MRRIRSWWLPVLALLVLPALVQAAPSTPACGAAAFLSSLNGAAGAGTYQPLAAEQRLYYGLDALGQDSPLEIRYLVKGKPYLTETMDLANARLPKVNPDSVLKPTTALDIATLLKEERMVELLALRPDLVRQLHKLAQEDASIRIEVRQQGRLFESLSFQDLVQRSAELGQSPAVQLAVRSSVSGPGDRRVERGRSPIAKDYLPDCNDCTESSPCDTECGYDPGKGGPVTCGEWGRCATTCYSSTTISEHWSAWYVTGSYNAGTACYVSQAFGGMTTFQLHVTQYRRDRIRTTLICPNAPACTDCYDQDSVISYELGSSGCYSDTYFGCFFGTTACCSALCSYSFYCNSSC